MGTCCCKVNTSHVLDTNFHAHFCLTSDVIPIRNDGSLLGALCAVKQSSTSKPDVDSVHTDFFVQLSAATNDAVHTHARRKILLYRALLVRDGQIPLGMARVPTGNWTNAAIVRTVDLKHSPLWFVSEYLVPIQAYEYTTAENAACLFNEALQALDSIHGAGLIHGDVAFVNMGRDQNGNLKFIDFGSHALSNNDPFGYSHTLHWHNARSEYSCVSRQLSSEVQLRPVDDIESLVYVIMNCHYHMKFHTADEKIAWSHSASTGRREHMLERQLAYRCRACHNINRNVRTPRELYDPIQIL